LEYHQTLKHLTPWIIFSQFYHLHNEFFKVIWQLAASTSTTNVQDNVPNLNQMWIQSPSHQENGSSQLLDFISKISKLSVINQKVDNPSDKVISCNIIITPTSNNSSSETMHVRS